MLSMTARRKNLDTGMKTKNKNSLFICQFSETAVKVVTCLTGDSSKGKFTGLEIETLPADIDDKRLTEQLARLFKKLGYAGNPVIVSLPRSKAATRYLKVPTQIPGEIENIVALQAPRYLPYPAEELITGHQVISTDKDGYSQINLIIVHKDVIERYVRIFKEIKCSGISIILSSYGLGNLYEHIYPDASDTVMIIDIDYQQVEVAIFSRKRLLFSRYFKLNRTHPDWENIFIDDILKTQDVYSREVSDEPLAKIMLTGAGKTYQEFAQILRKSNTDLSIEALSYYKINFADGLSNMVLGSENSFASIIGLGLKNVDENLNLLPLQIKDKSRERVQHQQRLQLGFFISLMFLVLGLGIAKNLNNKAMYLEGVKLELNKVAKEARLLEEIEKRLQLTRQRSENRIPSLDLLSELHQVIPGQVSLVTLTYGEDGTVTMRGQTPQLNSVFDFVGKLEKSAVFKGLGIKVRYATQKKTQGGDIVDFEIVCSKK